MALAHMCRIINLILEILFPFLFQNIKKKIHHYFPSKKDFFFLRKSTFFEFFFDISKINIICAEAAKVLL
jgi:hypothetical protein